MKRFDYASAYNDLKLAAIICGCNVVELKKGFLGFYIRPNIAKKLGHTGDQIYIRAGLSVRHKLFVLAHELGHGFVAVRNKTGIGVGTNIAGFKRCAARGVYHLDETISLRKRPNLGNEASANKQALKLLKALNVPNYKTEFGAFYRTVTGGRL